MKLRRGVRRHDDWRPATMPATTAVVAQLGHSFPPMVCSCWPRGPQPARLRACATLMCLPVECLPVSAHACLPPAGSGTCRCSGQLAHFEKLKQMVTRPTAASGAVPSLLPMTAVLTMPMMGSSSTLGQASRAGRGTHSEAARQLAQAQGKSWHTGARRAGHDGMPRWPHACEHAAKRCHGGDKKYLIKALECWLQTHPHPCALGQLVFHPFHSHLKSAGMASRKISRSYGLLKLRHHAAAAASTSSAPASSPSSVPAARPRTMSVARCGDRLRQLPHSLPSCRRHSSGAGWLPGCRGRRPGIDSVAGKAPLPTAVAVIHLHRNLRPSRGMAEPAE